MGICARSQCCQWMRSARLAPRRTPCLPGPGITEVQLAQAMQTGTRIENPYPPDVVLKPGCSFYDPRINLGEWKVLLGRVLCGLRRFLLCDSCEEMVRTGATAQGQDGQANCSASTDIKTSGANRRS